MKKIDPIDLTDFIGRPFQHNARGPAAYDCYGLAQAIAARRGFRLPDQATPDSVAMRLAMFRRVVSPFTTPLKSPEPYALILFDLRRRGIHIGTMTADPGRFIHVAEMTVTVTVNRLRHPYYQHSCCGFYRCTKQIDNPIESDDAPGPDHSVRLATASAHV